MEVQEEAAAVVVEEPLHSLVPIRWIVVPHYNVLPELVAEVDGGGDASGGRGGGD